MKKLQKLINLFLIICLAFLQPVTILAQAQEEVTESSELSTELIPTPTPTLTYREQLKADSDVLLQGYYERYGITPRPTRSPRSETDSGTSTTQTADVPSTSDADSANTADFNEADLSDIDGGFDEEEVVEVSETVDTVIPSDFYSGNDPVAANENTGSNSTNQADSSEDTSTVIDNENTVKQTDTFYESADTGFNSAGSITGSVTLTSGNADVTFEEANQFNSNQTGFPNSPNSPSTLTQSQNQNTGSDSDNIVNSETTNLTEIENVNILDLKQDGQVDVNTGFNLTKSVIGDSTIKSGDANVAVNLINTANTNINIDANVQIENYDIYDQQLNDLVIEFEQFDATGVDLGSNPNEFEEMDEEGLNQVLTENENTQSGSYNEANANQSEEIVIKNTNEAELDQDLEVNVNTGGNVADGNTGTTAIETGDINLAVNVVNFLNVNLTNVTNFLVGTVNIFGEMLGNIILPDPEATTSGETSPSSAEATEGKDVEASNSNTGSDTTNIATSISESSTQIVNEDDLLVENNVQMNLDTGANDISSINGGVQLETGSVESNVSTKTVGNVNAAGDEEEVFWLIVMNNLGEWAGDILGFEGENYAIIDGFGLFDQEDVNAQSSNENTLGDVNVAESELSQSTTIENTNAADIDTDLVINAATGGNLINSNNGDTAINTGDVKASANILNFANFNFSGKTVLVAVVNVFGQFVGNILPPGWVASAEVESVDAEESPLALEEVTEDQIVQEAQIITLAEGQGEVLLLQDQDVQSESNVASHMGEESNDNQLSLIGTLEVTIGSIAQPLGSSNKPHQSGGSALPINLNQKQPNTQVELANEDGLVNQGDENVLAQYIPSPSDGQGDENQENMVSAKTEQTPQKLVFASNGEPITQTNVAAINPIFPWSGAVILVLLIMPLIRMIKRIL